MIPPGAAHVTRPSIALAAQFAGIEYVDAVVGFDFARQKATARIDGIVVPEECVEGLLVVWEGMMERVLGEEERRRVGRVVERWRKFAVGLEIRRRLEERHGKVDEGDEMVVDDGDEGGGFLLSEAQGSTSGIGERTMDIEGYEGGYQYQASEPVRSVISEEVMQHENTLPGGVDTTQGEDVGDGIMDKEESNELEKEDEPNEEDLGGGFVMEEVESTGGLENKDASAGEDDSDESGGFIYEDEDGIL
jgi:Rad4 beta-hairpin domain 3